MVFVSVNDIVLSRSMFKPANLHVLCLVLTIFMFPDGRYGHSSDWSFVYEKDNSCDASHLVPEFSECPSLANMNIANCPPVDFTRPLPPICTGIRERSFVKISSSVAKPCAGGWFLRYSFLHLLCVLK